MPHTSAAPSPLPVLVIDRDYGTQLHIRRVLGGMCEVRIANAVSLGLGLLREAEHRLVLASLAMPGNMQGLHIVEAIKALPGYEGVPVIGLIPADLDNYQPLLRAECLADCLIKPVPTEELRTAVERVLCPEAADAAARRRARSVKADRRAGRALT